MKKISLVLLLFLTACFAKPDPYTGPTETIDQDLVAFPIVTSMDLVMVGDAIVHSNVFNDAKLPNGTYDFTDMLDLMKPIIEPYDLAFYNQETILGGSTLPITNYPRFNSPQEFGDAMVDAGFNLVSLANNHTYDAGSAALLKSDAYWKTKDAITSGAFATPEESTASNVYTKNGITFGFLAYTNGINGLYLAPENTYMINQIKGSKMETDVKALRPLVDVLIVSIHMGNEYSNYPNQWQQDTAKKLSDWGVDIVIGNHAHAIQPIQRIGKTLVYYALGNFLSGQEGTERLIGLTSAITIKKITYGNVTTIELTDLKIELSYNYYNQYKRNVRIYPWDKVTSSLLPDKADWEAKYLKIVNAMGANVSFSSVRK